MMQLLFEMKSTLIPSPQSVCRRNHIAAWLNKQQQQQQQLVLEQKKLGRFIPLRHRQYLLKYDTTLVQLKMMTKS